jgi:hypothetical protein
VASPTTLTPPPELDQRLLERPRHHGRGWLITLAVVLSAVLLAGLTLNWFGMLPWRGPMSAPDDQMGGVTETFDVPARHQVAYTLFIANPSRTSVVLDSVEPAGASPALDVTDAWFFVSTPRCRRISTDFPYGVSRDCRTPVQGHTLPEHETAGNAVRVIVMLRPTAAQIYRSSGFDVHYHVGPIHYTTTFTDRYVIHASAPQPPTHAHTS